MRRKGAGWGMFPFLILGAFPITFFSSSNDEDPSRTRLCRYLFVAATIRTSTEMGTSPPQATTPGRILPGGVASL
jgi:hypothetical protein